MYTIRTKNEKTSGRYSILIYFIYLWIVFAGYLLKTELNPDILNFLLRILLS